MDADSASMLGCAHIFAQRHAMPLANVSTAKHGARAQLLPSPPLRIADVMQLHCAGCGVCQGWAGKLAVVMPCPLGRRL